MPKQDSAARLFLRTLAVRLGQFVVLVLLAASGPALAYYFFNLKFLALWGAAMLYSIWIYRSDVEMLGRFQFLASIIFSIAFSVFILLFA
jgi:hypothetical protein